MKRLLVTLFLVSSFALDGYCTDRPTQNKTAPEPRPQQPEDRPSHIRRSPRSNAATQNAAEEQKATDGDKEAKPKKAPLEYDRSAYQPALVLIEGNEGVGTAFICKISGIPFIVTNIHVLGGADASASYDNGLNKINARTLGGKRLTPLSIFGAVGHDLCIIRFAEEAEYTDIALEFEPNIATEIHVSDDLVIPGNSKGAGVMVWTEGEVVGIGPDKVEHNAPIYTGNSGSPIIHLKSGKVIGVLSYAQQVPINDFFDKKSFNDKRSAIRSDIRYFGYRLDSANEWYQIELPRFSRQHKELKEFIDKRENVAIFLYTDDNDWRDHKELQTMMNEVDSLVRSRTINGRLTRETFLQANIAMTRRLEVIIKDDTYRNYQRYLHEHKNRRGGSQAYYPYFTEKIEREVQIRDHLARNIQEWENRVRQHMR